MLDFAGMNGQIFKKDVRLFLSHSCRLPVKKTWCVFCRTDTGSVMADTDK